MSHNNSKNGDKKHGRSKDQCKAYAMRGQREKNKLKKLLRHIRRYGAMDHTAVHFWNNFPARVMAGLDPITPVKSKCKRSPPKTPMRAGQ